MSTNTPPGGSPLRRDLTLAAFAIDPSTMMIAVAKQVPVRTGGVEVRPIRVLD